MKSSNIWLSLLVMITVIYSVRLLPMLLLRRNITNRFVRSFLYYVPYVTLSVMTFPAIMNATNSPVAGLLSLAAGIVLAWLGAGLFPVAITCSAVVFIMSFVL